MGISKLSESAFLRLRKEARPYDSFLIIGGVLALFSSLLDASLGLSLKYLVDDVNDSQIMNILSWAPLAIFIFFVVRGVFNFSSEYAITYAGRSVIASLRIKLFNHILKLPKQFHDNNSSSSLLSRIIYNVEQVANTSSKVLISVFKDITMVIALLISMVIISWQFVVVLLLSIPFVFMVIKFGSYKSRVYSHRLQSSMSSTTEHTVEVFDRIELVKVHQAEDFESNKMSSLLENNRRLELKSAVASELTTSMIQLLLSVPAMVITYLIANGHLEVTLGSCVAFIIVLTQFMRPLKRLTDVNAEIQKGLAGAQNIFQLFDINQEGSKSEIMEKFHSCRLEDLSFSYSDESVGLLKVNVSVNVGERIAVVGPSGSGKSSLLKVLAGYYLDQIKGSYYVDDHLIKDSDVQNLRQHIAYASQNHTEISASIKDNVIYSQDENLDDYKAVLNAVKLTEEIEELGGLNTLIGEQHSKTLSGGQRQRIALARALYSKNVSMILLDEVTSALDRNSEMHVWQSIFEMAKDKILIASTHHSELFGDFDRVLFVKEGRIIADGSHQDLLNNSEEYVRFCGDLERDTSSVR